MRTYDFTLTTADGENVEVSLRLTANAQKKLKDNYKGESTYTSFCNAMDDPSRLIDILGMSLKYKDNQNEIQSGEELLDLMADNDMLGFSGKAELLCNLLYVSGIANEEQRDKILANFMRVIKHDILLDFDDLDGAGTEQVKSKGKNA